MTTFDIMLLDVRKEEQRKILIKYFESVPPVKRIKERKYKDRDIPMEEIENIYHNIMSRYNYATQGIQEYYEDGVFHYYNICVLKIEEDRTRTYDGYVTSKTLREALVKIIIKVYREVTGKE